MENILVFNEGFVFAGAQSTVKSSFIYGITLAHLAHIFAGLIVLLVVIYNHLTKKYSATNSLGLELGAIFWHFVDILWIYLFFFFYFLLFSLNFFSLHFSFSIGFLLFLLKLFLTIIFFFSYFIFCEIIMEFRGNHPWAD